ncbi:NAD(P)-binding domain-containing protein [Bordetella petrii]|uniref:NAD(P)-binding domain-containing protein n=1 Tax=Bordetella petrii TaxID=94624 RepID=UPI003AF36508
MISRIGIVGLGSAGAAAARKLLADGPADLALTVFDTAVAQCEAFRGAATLAATAGEVLRESDLVLLALPCQREIDRTLERFSDGQVGADVQGKLVWNLAPLPAAQDAGLRRALEAAGAGYIVTDAQDPAALARLLRRCFDAGDAQAVARAMQAA